MYSIVQLIIIFLLKKMISLQKYLYKPFSFKLLATTGFYVGITCENTCYNMLKYNAMTVFLYATVGDTIEWE